MDRPTRRMPKGHHHHHQQRRSQSQHIVPEGATSTESENEDGNAVYESLTTANKGRTSFTPKSTELSAISTMTRRQAGISDLIPITNLDTAPRNAVNNNRKDYSKSQLYELIRLSSDNTSPENDIVSENSEGNRASECSTVAASGGPYSVPSEVSCGHHHQYGVQQLSAQNLQNLTSHHRYHHPGRESAIYFTTTDLDDAYLDKHASASSPTTSSSDRCLLPTSSSVNICKVSNKHCGGLISATSTASDRHLYRQQGPSMSHPTDLISRHTLSSDHYLANTIRRSGQCPIHTDGMLTNLRNHLRPASTAKPVIREPSKFRKIFTWRNAAALLGLVSIALIAALVYYAVVSMGKSRHDELRTSRDQNVISDSQYGGESVSSIVNKERYKRSNNDTEISTNFTELSNETLGNETYPVWEYEPSIIFPGENESHLFTITSEPMNKLNETNGEKLVKVPKAGITSKKPENVTFSITNKGVLKSGTEPDVMQSDQPVKDSKTAHTFSVLQTLVLTFDVDEKGRPKPKILLKDSRVVDRSLLEFSPRAPRDVKDNQSWDEEDQGFPFDGRGVYPNEDQIIALQVGSLAEVVVPGQSFWIARLVQRTDGFVSLNLTVTSLASAVLYGRRDAPPKHSHYDFARLVQSARMSRRSADDKNSNVNVFRERLDAGVWFLGIYNDQEKEEKLLFSILTPDAFCPNDCSLHGTCSDGQCKCMTGFGGDDCSQVVCPLLCSGHGQYSQGACQCSSGWKGVDCATPQYQCDHDCSSRGKCVSGKCDCDGGYSGASCETTECPSECSINGACINGTCFCQPGWQGVLCQTPLTDARQLCSHHGSFDSLSKKCLCDASWSGESCSHEICQPSCSLNGKCENRICVCDSGYSGPTCENRRCPNCGPKGTCVNGSCVCEKGWFGRLCSANGCPDDCSGHGVCNKTTTNWKCQCQPMWKGDNCATPKEIDCKDGVDNDNDGLADCEDADCCMSNDCTENQNCVSSPDPREVLLKEQAPADTATFFEKVRFLIRESGVQSFADRSSFDQKRASVLRGKVVDSNNAGLVGVRVSASTFNGSTSPWGFTISRKDGMFDLLLNGGGSFLISFQKSGFRQTSSTVYLSWNEFSAVDIVKMYRESEAVHKRVDFIPSGGNGSSTCDLFSPKPDPKFYPYWKHISVDGLTSGSTVHYKAQVLQESLNISEVDLVMNHFSSRTNGFYSLLLITLTNDTIPEGLNRITIRISNAGVQEEAVYDGNTNLRHLYAWNGFNAYKQQVFGFSQAKVSIGYESANCKEALWIHKTIALKGMDLPISDVGGWDFSVHHRYNTEGILHRGDGSNVILNEGQLLVTSVAGNGKSRQPSCRNGCSAASAASQSFISPVAVVSGLDGSLYIGDFNFIYRVKTDGSIVALLELQSPAMLQKYFMATNPFNGQIYVSIPQILKVIRILSLETSSDLAKNFEVVAGNGEQCVPILGKFECGDGHSATAASLIYPKGIAFDKYGTMYIADGASVRMVDIHGSISTLIPPKDYHQSWSPGSHFCAEVTEFTDLSLRWPTSVAVNPADDHVYILDNSRVIELNLLHRKATTMYDIEPNCDSVEDSMIPVSMDVAANGALFILETRAKNWQIKKLEGRDARVILNSCNDSSSCAVLPSRGSESIQLPTDIAVSPDGQLLIADAQALKVFRAGPALPRLTPQGGYIVEDYERGEVYTFNEFGHHLRTNDLITKALVHQFTYTADTAFGKLKSVMSGGKTLNLQRDYRNSVRSLEAGNGWKISITNTIRGLLKDATYNNGYQMNFGYESETGLISGKSDSAGKSYNYQYDKTGRLIQVTFPIGTPMIIPHSDPSSISSSNVEKVLLLSPSVMLTQNLRVKENGAIQSVLLSSGRNSSLKFDMTIQNRTQSIRKNMKINGNTIWSLEFAPATNEKMLSDADGVPVFSTKLDEAFRPVAARVLVSDFAPANFSHDSAGRLLKWSQGSRSETSSYNQQGQLIATKMANGASWKYDYNDQRQLVKVTKGSGPAIELEYDTVGGLTSATTPKGEKWILADENMLLFRRISIQSPLSNVHFSTDLNSQDQIIGHSYPSGLKNSYYIRGEDGKVTGILGGKSSFNLSYNHDGHLEKVIATGAISFLSERKYHESSLLKSQTSTFSGSVQLESEVSEFDYDASFNLVRRKVKVGSKDVPVTDLQYNPKTHQLRKFGPFSFSQSQIGAIIVSDDNAIFLRQLNNMGKTRNFVLRLQQKVAASTELSYNEMGQLAELKIRKRDADPSVAFGFKYDLDGQLIEATKNKQAWCSYSYDLNGNIFSSTANGVALTANYTTGDRLSGVQRSGKDILVSTDLDGFVVQYGDMKLVYNAFGLLEQVWKNDKSLDIKYFYDHQHRLIARHSATGNEVTQYIYDDEHRISHVFHKKSLIQIYYDSFGQQIAMSRDAVMFYIVQSPVSTIIINSQGQTVKEQMWSPFGTLESESSPEFYYPFDQKSRIRDVVSSVVFHERSRPYHPEIGRFLAPSFGDLKGFKLSSLNAYIFQENDRLMTEKERSPLLNMEDWAELFGMSNVFQKATRRLNFQEQCQQSTTLTVENSPCFRQNMFNLDFTSTKQPPLQPQNVLSRPHRISSILPFYNKGVIFSPSSNTLSVYRTGTGSRVMNEALENIFNNTLIAPWTVSGGNLVKVFVAKQGDASILQMDASRLQSTIPKLNLTKIQLTSTILIQSGNLVFNMTYYPSLSSSLSSIKSFVTDQAVSKALTMERSQIDAGETGLLWKWNDNERALLSKSGSVPGFRGYFLRDPVAFPQLANEVFNVALTRS